MSTQRCPSVQLPVTTRNSNSTVQWLNTGSVHRFKRNIETVSDISVYTLNGLPQFSSNSPNVCLNQFCFWDAYIVRFHFSLSSIKRKIKILSWFTHIIDNSLLIKLFWEGLQVRPYVVSVLVVCQYCLDVTRAKIRFFFFKRQI